MSETMNLGAYCAGLPVSNTATTPIAVENGQMVKLGQYMLAYLALMSVEMPDLDNPTQKGFVTMRPTSVITRPDKGSGWDFGFMLNLATATGIQIWFNYAGYIAIRGKGSAGAAWSKWYVHAPMT